MINYETINDPQCLLNENFEELLENFNLWEIFRGSKILITGGTGLIGSVYAKSLSYVSDKLGLDICVSITYRSDEKLTRLYGKSGVSNIKFVKWSASDSFNSADSYDYVIHTVNDTNSLDHIEKPVKTILTTINGTNNLLANLNIDRLKRFVYCSSMEVYGFVGDSNFMTVEDDDGFIDTLSLRSNYPLSKKIAENLCVAYQFQYNIPVIILRLAQTFGAGSDWTDNRVYTQFSKSVLNRSDIVLHTNGASRGNYVSIMDSLTGTLTAMVHGANGEAYNVVNEANSLTISEMANLVATTFQETGITVRYDIPRTSTGYAPDTFLRLSSKKLSKLGWVPKHDLKRMYRDTVKYLELISR